MALMVTTAMNKVKVRAIPIVPAILAYTTYDEFPVLVRVEAPPAARKGVPVDLVALLDISGSMNDPAAAAKKPSRLDLLKKAMKFVIGQLHDGDRLAIVAFNKKVVADHSTDMMEMSHNGRSYATETVDELVAKGDTAIKPGLEQAVKILDGRSDKNTSRVGFIILLTDGLDNSGMKWNDDILPKADPVRELLAKYPVHSLGLCAAHDPRTLLFVASESRGTYSFVDDGSNVADALAVCLGGLKTVVAIDMAVDIVGYAHDGFQLKSIDSGGYKSTVESSIRGAVMVGTLYAGEVKNFVAHFRATSERGPGSNEYVCNLLARYTDICAPGGLGGASVSADSPGWTVVPRVSSWNLSPQQQIPSAEVLDQIIRFKVLGILAGLQKDRFDGLKHVHAKKEDEDEQEAEARKAKGAARTLRGTWEELKRCDQQWRDARERGLDLRGLEEDVEEMVVGLQRGLGVAAIYSWMSSHQMQRATAMGSLLSTRFLTPAMKAMVHEAQQVLQVPPEDARDEAPESVDRQLELCCVLKLEGPLVFRPEASPSPLMICAAAPRVRSSRSMPMHELE